MKGLFAIALNRVSTTFLAGLLVILPLVLTIAVIIWVANILQSIIGPSSIVGGWLQSAGMHLAPAGNMTLAYVIGCLFVLVSVFLLGMLVRTGIRKAYDRIIGVFIRRIPVARSVYSAATQFVGLLEHKEEADLKRMSVVYCTFGDKGGSGMLALLPNSNRYPINGRDHYLVYLPTSPIPMTGGLLFVPVDSVQKVKMSIEELMSIYLSMGVTGKEFFNAET